MIGIRDTGWNGIQGGEQIGTCWVSGTVRGLELVACMMTGIRDTGWGIQGDEHTGYGLWVGPVGGPSCTSRGRGGERIWQVAGPASTRPGPT